MHDQERDKRDVPILVLAPGDDECLGLFADDARGLPVSLRRLLQNLHVQSLIRNQSLQPCILFLKRLELLHHVRLHPTVLLAPTIVRLLRDLEQLASLGNRFAFAKFHIRAT